MRKFLFLIVSGWMLFGLVLQFFNPFRPSPSDPRPPHLAQTVAPSVPGWTMQERQLGSTESVVDRTKAILQFDDVVYRRFSRGEEYFELYVAYWGPSRMPMQKVASHTPDRCWTQIGWKPVDRDHDVVVAPAGNPLKPAQWRIFDVGGTREYVFFWHVVGDRIYDYGDHFNSFPHPVKWLRDAFKWNFQGSEEQYFIRINGNVPLKELLSDPGFAEAVNSLRPLGLDPAPVDPA